MKDNNKWIMTFGTLAEAWIAEVENMLPANEREIVLTEQVHTGIEIIEKLPDDEKQNYLVSLLVPVCELLVLQKLDSTQDTVKLRELKTFIMELQ